MSSLPRRLKARGPVKERWHDHQDRSRRAVFYRCRERCEAEDCTNAATEWAHLFGRRNVIAEPWASSPSLTMGLCAGCHRAIDGPDPDLRDRLQWVGLVRLCQAERAPLSLLDDRTPEGAARALEVWLVEQMKEREG